MPKLLTLCLVGVDADTKALIESLLESQRSRLEARWRPAPYADANLLLIDADSVYGHMDWLKAQSSGRPAVALTGAPDAHDPEHRLRKPVTSADLVALLNRLGAHLAGSAAPASTPALADLVEPAELILRPPPAPPELHLTDLLAATPALTGPLRLAADGLPTLVLDAQARTWHSSATLKALSGWCTRALSPNEVRFVDAGELPNAIAGLPGHPYARLQWLVHLLSGAGHLDASLDAGARYRLSRWPQSEREFPKHFRIATIMLKQASTLEEIAAQSGAEIGDVADFVNAYHALGFVEHDAPAERPADEVRRGGLFGRAKKTSAIS
jgi:hypothetical protein